MYSVTIFLTIIVFFTTSCKLDDDRVKGRLSGPEQVVSPPPPLIWNSSKQNIVVDGSYTFAGEGGVPPYSFQVVSGGGSIDGTTGEFTAPSNTSTVTIRVFDALNESIEFEVNVYPVLEPRRTFERVLKPDSIHLAGVGGMPPYTYTLTSGEGTVDSVTGEYVGPNYYTVATIEISDSEGNVSSTSVWNNGMPNGSEVPIFWLRAEDLELQDGDSVNSWASHDSGGLSFSAPGTAPTFVNDYKNGYPAVRFDGTAYLESSSLPLPNDFTIFVVSQADDPTPATKQVVLSHGGVGEAEAENVHYEVYYSSSQGGGFFEKDSGVDTSIPYGGIDFSLLRGLKFSREVAITTIGFGVFNGGGFSGSNHGSWGVPATGGGNGLLRLGAEAGGGNPLTGHICEIIIYSTPLDLTESIPVQSHFGHKYSLSTN